MGFLLTVPFWGGGPTLRKHLPELQGKTEYGLRVWLISRSRELKTARPQLLPDASRFKPCSGHHSGQAVGR